MSRYKSRQRSRKTAPKRKAKLPPDIQSVLTRHPQQSYALLRSAFGHTARRADGGGFSSETESRYALSKYKVIDLFAGAGGFTLGFIGTGRFETVFANDFNKYAVKTYNANFGDHCIDGDINDLLANRSLRLPHVDVVIGGPPCQGFSLLNKQREGDPRKQLWRAYLDVVERVRATVFVMENVPELLASSEFDQIKERAESLGYLLVSAVLNAADYGVPQRRKRAIVIGSLKGMPKIPAPTHVDPKKSGSLFSHGLLPWETVERAIGDLPKPQGTEIKVGSLAPPLDIHFGRTPTKESLLRYKCIPEGGNRFDLHRARPDLTPKCWIRKKSGGTDLFGRLWRERPAFTIRTEFFKPEKGRYLHPSQHRPITHREAARLMSFPDSFTFLGTKIEVAKQIGNAVPPMLAKKIAQSVLSHLDAQNS